MMIFRVMRFVPLLFVVVSTSALTQLPVPKPSHLNAWNWRWKLDVKRSSPDVAGEGVPQVYRFSLGPGDGSVVPIQWEIPELGEIVKGATNGELMPIHRTRPSPGLALGVRREGNAVLLYRLYKNGKDIGGGRMMLVDQGTA